MPRGRPPKLDAKIDEQVIASLSHVYDQDRDRLLAIRIAIEWVKVKHKLSEAKEGSAFEELEELENHE